MRGLLLLLLLLGCNRNQQPSPPRPITIKFNYHSGDCGELSPIAVHMENVFILKKDEPYLLAFYRNDFDSNRVQVGGWLRLQNDTLVGRQQVQILGEDGSAICSGTYDTVWSNQ